MATFDHRPYRTALIPWVIAMVTLIGLNALVPDHARARKIQSSGELELSQLAEDAQLPGRISHSQAFPVPHPADGAGTLSSSSRLVLIEKRREQPTFRFEEGAIRGRAPPARLLA